MIWSSGVLSKRDLHFSSASQGCQTIRVFQLVRMEDCIQDGKARGSSAREKIDSGKSRKKAFVALREVYEKTLVAVAIV
jgi:uncharacterized FlgJ-related protein